MESIVETQSPLIQEQGVLRDVLDELDRERSRRAELEIEVRKLKDQQQQYQESLTAASAQAKETIDVPVSRREYIAMETERDGFKELVNALTADNDAVTVAMESKEKTLPLHVIRMLEIMPYDPRAVQSAKAEDEVSCNSNSNRTLSKKGNVRTHLKPIFAGVRVASIQG